jgi:hypothetical protein
VVSPMVSFVVEVTGVVVAVLVSEVSLTVESVVVVVGDVVVGDDSEPLSVPPPSVLSVAEPEAVLSVVTPVPSVTAVMPVPVSESDSVPVPWFAGLPHATVNVSATRSVDTPPRD